MDFIKHLTLGSYVNTQKSWVSDYDYPTKKSHL
jgi:hypothetical protein